MKYRAEIDGLRALAVIPVILFHAGLSLFSGGYVGVDIFFVISGYLITAILIAEIEEKRFSLAKFYERRARRILPALFFVMLCCLPLAWATMLPKQLEDFFQSVLAVSLFASNILFWRESGYFAAAAEEKPLLHTWSLAVEEQYYVLFPIFLLLAWRFGKDRVFWMIAVFAAISLILSEWGWRNQPDANFYLAPFRAWELFAGSIAAFIVRRRGVRKNNMLALIGLAAILYSIFAFDEATPFPSVYALAPVLGTVLVVLYADAQTFVSKLLSAKILVGIGLISYSAYLWHQPLFAFARIHFFTEPGLEVFLGLSLASLVLAFFSWKFVEQPFRRKDGLSTARLLVVSVVGLGLFGALGLYGFAQKGFPGRFTAEQQAILNLQAVHERLRDDGGCNREKQQTDLTKCVYGADFPPSIALLGDSHAAGLAHELGLAAGRRNQSVVQYTKNGCLPALGVNDAKNERCGDFVQAALEDIRATEALSTIVVFSRLTFYMTDGKYDNTIGGVETKAKSRYTVGDIPLSAPEAVREPALIEALATTLERLARENPDKTILMIEPIPEHGWNVPHQLVKAQRLGIALPNLPRTVFEARNARVMARLEALREIENLRFVDAGARLCTQTECLATRDGVPLYFDDDHLTNQGSALLVDALLPKLRYPNAAPLSQAQF